MCLILLSRGPSYENIESSFSIRTSLIFKLGRFWSQNVFSCRFLDSFLKYIAWLQMGIFQQHSCFCLYKTRKAWDDNYVLGYHYQSKAYLNYEMINQHQSLWKLLCPCSRKWGQKRRMGASSFKCSRLSDWFKSNQYWA